MERLLLPSTNPQREDLCEYAEMGRGDAFMMLAWCFHGGSANTADEERLILWEGSRKKAKGHTLYLLNQKCVI